MLNISNVLLLNLTKLVYIVLSTIPSTVVLCELLYDKHIYINYLGIHGTIRLTYILHILSSVNGILFVAWTCLLKLHFCLQRSSDVWLSTEYLTKHQTKPLKYKFK